MGIKQSITVGEAVIKQAGPYGINTFFRHTLTEINETDAWLDRYWFDK